MRKGGYYDSENNKRWTRVLIVLLIAIIIALIIYYLLLGNRASRVENNLLTAGKDYYASGDVLFPEAIGECGTATLDVLLSNGYIKNEGLFTKCNKTATYIKVCKLQSGKYHYTPVISCGTKDDTLFGEWKKGNESNLIEDKSNVRFSFIAQVYSSKGKAYYPNNKSDVNEVSELYVSSPSSEYTYKDGGVKASKWYTEQSGTTYWNGGAYSSTQPAGYPNQGSEGTPITSISLTKPASASYRTISEVKLYRTLSVSKPYALSYVCIDINYGNSQIISNVPCESRSEDNYNTMLAVQYTCDGKNIVSGNSVCESKPTSDWSTSVCTKSSTQKCESKKGYKYVDRRWNWYTSGTYRKYYPSGSSTSAGEKTYYDKAPVSGAIQDSTTTTTAYKYYKLVENANSADGEWMNLNEDYVSEEELLELFNKSGYSIKSLEEILESEKIKYSVQLEYSNRE